MQDDRAAVKALEACCAPLSAAPLDDDLAGTLAAAFAALADPVRLKLLSLIATNGELCSCDLTGPLNRSQPTVSHHTRVLAEAGLIAGDRRGRWVYWSVVPERLEALQTVLGPGAIPAGQRLRSSADD